jgi:drug/metabolite transporter (DMT)-like permease
MILFSITLGSFGQICLKLGMGAHKIAISSNPFQTILNIILVMIRPYVLAGLCLYVISTFSWLLVISRVRLSVAYPMISMSYVLVVVLSSLILHEKIDWRFAGIGLACISVGVSFIGFGLGQISGK